MLRGRIKISADQVIGKRHCWNDQFIKEWAIKTTGSETIDYADIVNATDMSIVDKLWITWEFPVFPDEELHEIAVAFARHWLTGVEPEAPGLLSAKLMWLNGLIGDDGLKCSQNAAWEESKIFPTVKSTAYALAKNARIAITGAAGRAGGDYGAEIDPVEKMWQWDTVLYHLKRRYGEDL